MFGDFNARSGNMEETSTCRVYEQNKYYFDISNHTEFIKRYSVDNVVNNYGKKLLSLCPNMNIFIVNGRIGKSEWTCKNASVVDYCLASPSLFVIDTFDPMLSDVHSPLVCSLKLAQPQKPQICFQGQWKSCQTKELIDLIGQTITEGQDKPQSTKRSDQNIVQPKWNPSLQQKYIDNLDESRINKIHLKRDKASAREVYDDKEINSLNQDITQWLLDAAEEIEICDPRKLRLVKKNYKNSVKRHKPWFSITCRQQHKLYLIAKK